MNNEQHFIILEDRPAIRYDALNAYAISAGLTKEAIKIESKLWSPFLYKSEGKFRRFVFIDCITEERRKQLGLPEPEFFLTEECKKSFDPNQIRANKLTTIKLYINSAFCNWLNRTDKRATEKFFEYVDRGYAHKQAAALSRAYGLLLLSYGLRREYTTKDIYDALLELSESSLQVDKQTAPYYIEFLDDISVRTFYRYLEKATEDNLDDFVIHGLFGKQGNRSLKCENTKNLVIALKCHINGITDVKVTKMVNTIILALPSKYNKGRKINRRTVCNLKNSNLSTIKSATEGEDYLYDKVLNEINRTPTKYPLDRVEADFTFIHAEMESNQGPEEKVNRTVFKIIDVASKASLACEVGTGEPFELFRKGFSSMLRKTGNVLPAEFAFDKSPSTRSKDFERIKNFLNSLIGGSGPDESREYFTFTKRPKGKGTIESNWNSSLTEHLSLHVGIKGGNIATSKRHRPKKSILKLFVREEYIHDDAHWEHVIKECDYKYNHDSQGDGIPGRLETFYRLPKPHGIQLSENIVAFVSWRHTVCTFLNMIFTFTSENRTYRFGWLSGQVKNDKAITQFILDSTNKQFDLYYNLDSSKCLVFELNTMKFLRELTLVESFYGNKIDQANNPGSRTKLKAELKSREALKSQIIALTDKVINDAEGVLEKPLQELVDEFSRSEDFRNSLESILLQALSTKEVKSIDPFHPEGVKPKPMKKVKIRNMFKPGKAKKKRYEK